MTATLLSSTEKTINKIDGMDKIISGYTIFFPDICSLAILLFLMRREMLKTVADVRKISFPQEMDTHEIQESLSRFSPGLRSLKDGTEYLQKRLPALLRPLLNKPREELEEIIEDLNMATDSETRLLLNGIADAVCK